MRVETARNGSQARRDRQSHEDGQERVLEHILTSFITDEPDSKALHETRLGGQVLVSLLRRADG